MRRFQLEQGRSKKIADEGGACHFWVCFAPLAGFAYFAIKSF
jgi:hypothetical protein